ASTRNTWTGSSTCSSGCTAATTTRAPAWGWLSAARSSSGTAAPSPPAAAPARGRRSSSPCRPGVRRGGRVFEAHRGGTLARGTAGAARRYTEVTRDRRRALGRGPDATATTSTHQALAPPAVFWQGGNPVSERRRPITILMADDDPDDRLMTREAFAESRLA